MKFVETHFHLDYLKAYPHEDILSKSREQGVEKFITISVEPDNLPTVRALTEQYEDLYCTQGVHPHDAVKMTDDTLKEIEREAKSSDKCVAIGEIGLDYHYEHSPRNVQREVFCQQLDIASRLNLPVVIHSRDADEDTEDVLKDFSCSGVIHSFTAGQKLAQFALNKGFFLGFNGIITFKNAEDVRHILEMTPEDHILIETDAPFLAPHPHRGRENGPYYLPLVAQQVAKVKQQSLEELAPLFYENSHRLFKRLK